MQSSIKLQVMSQVIFAGDALFSLIESPAMGLVFHKQRDFVIVGMVKNYRVSHETGLTLTVQ